jgi:DNA-binding NtrC family response regulator
MTNLRCVLVTDADEQSGALVRALAACGVAADRASSGGECLVKLEDRTYDAILAIKDPAGAGAEPWLDQARQRWPGLAVIVVSDNGREALHPAGQGLGELLPAGLSPEEIAVRVRKRIEQAPAGAGLSQHPAADPLCSTMIGRSRAILDVIETIRLIAPKRCTVLITGPTGTGKELAARLIHAHSPRASLAMVTVNCGAIPESLLESEFFGHIKGAFTGAIAARAGRFEQAHRSTLFLDEIGEMPLELQAKVLRAVQEREFQRVGSSKTVQVDVRILAATNSDLAAKVRRGEFREDLYYRLNVVPIRMPALAEHREDVPLLVDHFLEKLCREEALPRKRIVAAALERLTQYHWPGNVRQLQNAVEKAVVLSGERQDLYPSDFALSPDEEPLSLADGWPRGAPHSGLRLPPEGVDLEAFLKRLERNLLEQALERAAGNKKRAADILRLKRTTLAAKLQISGVRFPVSGQR